MKKAMPIALVLILCFTFLLSGCKSEQTRLAELLSLGNRYLSEADYENALLAFEKVLELDEKNSFAYLRIAEVYVSQGDLPAAIETLRRGVEATGDENLAAKAAEYTRQHEQQLATEQSQSAADEAERQLGGSPDAQSTSETIPLQTLIDEQVAGTVVGIFEEDFDGDGVNEAFVFTSEIASPEYPFDGADLWYVSQTQCIVIVQNNDSVNAFINIIRHENTFHLAIDRDSGSIRSSFVEIWAVFDAIPQVVFSEYGYHSYENGYLFFHTPVVGIPAGEEPKVELFWDEGLRCYRTSDGTVF